MVSVIVPCFNYGHFLTETLQAVSNQTHPDLECIVVDDGSTDNTKEITDTFAKKDSRVHYIHQSNQGLSAARNTGIENAKGDWIQFLDADDLIHHRKLELQTQFGSANPSASVVFSDFRYFRDDLPNLDSRITTPVETKFFSSKEAMTFMLKQNMAVVNAPLVRADAVRETGLFDVTYRSLEDWNYWFRMSAKGKTFAKVQYDEPLAFVRSHPASMSKHVSRMLTAHNQLTAFMQSNIDGEMISRLSKDARDFKGKIIFEELQTGQLSTGLSWALRSMAQSPSSISWFMRNILYSLKVRMRR